MTWTLLGTRLAQLGGGNLRLMDKVPSAKGRFIQMGLVLLSTAGLAVVSMSFALIDGLKTSPWIAIPLGFVWAFIILNIDRLLIQNIRPGDSLGRTVGVMVPRLMVAVLLGIVIAVPLVLRIFNTEIQAEMQRGNAENINIVGGIRADSPDAKRLTEIESKVAKNKDILNGNVPPATASNVQAAQTILQQAQQNLTAKQQAEQAAYAKWRCEVDGSLCNGGTGIPGNGPEAKALEHAHDVAVDTEDDARRAVLTAQRALDDANKAANATNSTALQEAQTQARKELPGLLKEGDELRSRLGMLAANDSAIQANSTGLLARIQALNGLSARSQAASLAHWAVTGLLFMIELLPVLMKFLTTLGSPSLYDRIAELEDDTSYDDATRERNDGRRRIEQDSRKRREVDDDMRSRETSLGIMANEHVARRMESILDAALQQWGEQVTNTLHTSSIAGNGNVPGPPISTSTDKAVSSDAVRRQYGLPQSENL